MTSIRDPEISSEPEGPSNDDLLFSNENHTLPTSNNDRPTLHLTSFGYRIGPLFPTPDITFDIRALPNPPKSVRTGRTGLSQTLREGFFADERVQRRFREICARIKAHVEEADARGRRMVRVGVCCEIGRHRSVAVVEELGHVRFEGWNVVVGHRDVHRVKKSGRSTHDHRRANYADGT
ncbi:hypothetical protein BDN70DRAFT_870713 [Pholiota conissans]|uniref:RapZ C-terminal domain-containing protein n=1 Tax=Pholiota conissans TaxID=109636 RepID=A0A9P5ZE84_9AGAR|nr:hypothetical protein BDN70DRAFT_870713 [Pholiota conissans]